MNDKVLLAPPVEVMRPTAATEIPQQPDPPRWQFSPKLDGFRCCVFALGDRAVLQSRSGRDMADAFPTITAAAGQLPPGTVLDGELVAHRDGRFAFEELLRSAGARERDGVHVAFVAFDVLAVPGHDIRALMLADRWSILGDVLDGVRPPLERILATGDRDVAQRWYAGMAALGVEGIVARELRSPYQGGRTPSGRWVKVRHADTVDAVLLGVVGPLIRPRAVLVELPDGRRVVTSPRLDAVQARAVAGAVRGHLGPESEGSLTPVTGGLSVEVRAGSGRHGSVRFVRVRPDV